MTDSDNDSDCQGAVAQSSSDDCSAAMNLPDTFSAGVAASVDIVRRLHQAALEHDRATQPNRRNPRTREEKFALYQASSEYGRTQFLLDASELWLLDEAASRIMP